MLQPLQLVTALLIASSSLAAQDPEWRLIRTGGFSPVSPAGTYDHLRGRMVIFGGFNGYQPSNLVQEVDGETLYYGTPTTQSPPARGYAALVYDTKAASTLLFGGAVVGAVNFPFTWSWDGANWTQLAPVHSPPVRFATAMAFDEARERVVMFGGAISGVGPSSDTWEWDGSDWQQLSPATQPSARHGHTMTYDSVQGEVVMFGGVGHTDTWRYDGVDWRPVATTGVVTTAAEISMAFDRERNRLVVMATDGVFELVGNAWTQVASPPGTNTAGFGPIVYDRQLGRIVYYQSGRFPASTPSIWAYESDGLAIAQPFGVGCGTPALAAIPDANARPVLGQTATVNIEHTAAGGVAFMSWGWSNRQALGLALPADMNIFGLPGCWLLQSDDAIALPCTSTGPTTARFEVAIPNWVSLVGLKVYLQPWTIAPGYNPGNAVVGNGVAWTVGSR